MQDEVDRLVANWRRERPGTDVAPFEVLSRVTRLARHLDVARKQTFADHGVEGWEFDVLAALRRAGRPYQLSPSELARINQVTSGTVTHRLHLLEQSGLVARRPDPADGRGLLVRLTPAGRRRVDACLDDLVARERELLRPLAAAQQRTLAGLLRELTLWFE